MYVTIWWVLHITVINAFKESDLIQWLQRRKNPFVSNGKDLFSNCQPVLSWTMSVKHEKSMKCDTDFNWLYIAYLLKLFSSQY
jgi:hypothetical protein